MPGHLQKFCLWKWKHKSAPTDLPVYLRKQKRIRKPAQKAGDREERMPRPLYGILWSAFKHRATGFGDPKDYRE